MLRRLLVSLLLLAALPAQAVTRLYFGNGSNADAFVAFTADAGWEDASEIWRGPLHVGTPLRARRTPLTWRNVTLTPSSANQDLDIQWQLALAPGVEFVSGVTTVTMQGIFRETVGDADVTQCILGIRVLATDGTVRATLLSVANYGSTTELSTGHGGKVCADGDTVQANYTAVDGDFLVVEQGYQNDGATGGASGAANILSDGSGYIGVFNTTTLGDCTAGDETSACALRTSWIEFSNTITAPTDVSAGPTRWWFPSSGAADVSPAITGWSASNEVQYFQLSGTTKGSSANLEGQTVDMPSSTFTTEVDRVYISDPLQAGIVFSEAVTTMRGVIMARMVNAGDNIQSVASRVGIISNDGSVVRKLLTGTNGVGYTELNTAQRNHPISFGTAIGDTYTTVSGDRLMIGLGFMIDDQTPDADPQGIMVYGEANSDCAAINFTNTTGCSGWIEFSNNITLDTADRRPIIISRLLDSLRTSNVVALLTGLWD